MRRIAFTGPQSLTTRERLIVVTVLNSLPAPSSEILIVTGGCIGADELIATTMYARGYSIHTVVPAILTLVDPLYKTHCTSYEVTPPGRTSSETYRIRNTRMVGMSDELIAFLKHGDTTYRSGEVMTYNIARRAGKPIRVVAL